MKKNILPVIIVGTAGSSKETYEIIKKVKTENINDYFEVVGFIEKNTTSVDYKIPDFQKIIGTDSDIPMIASSFEKLGIVIPNADPEIKERLHNKYKTIPNVIFPNIIHPSVIVDGSFEMGVGNIISAGCVIACDLRLGNFNLINRCCTTGHDVFIGDYNTINPRSVVSGNVNIGNRCLLGAASVILQGLSIADDVILGAGAVLTKNTEKAVTLFGVPARKMK